MPCALLCLAACASNAGSASVTGRMLMAHDDGRAEGVVAFPNDTFESVVRFTLPPGSHQLARLWLAVAGAGSLQISLYESTPLDAPGDPFYQVTREVPIALVSDGRDSRWTVQDLSDVSPRSGVVWVGVKKAGGEAALWATPMDAGHYFVRSTDPNNRIEMLPVRRTPLVRLELMP